MSKRQVYEQLYTRELKKKGNKQSVTMYFILILMYTWDMGSIWYTSDLTVTIHIETCNIVAPRLAPWHRRHWCQVFAARN